MTKQHIHETHAQIVKRPNRTEGHLRRVIEMFDDGRSCQELVQQLHSGSSKPTKNVSAEFKAIARYL